MSIFCRWRSKKGKGVRDSFAINILFYFVWTLTKWTIFRRANRISWQNARLECVKRLLLLRHSPLTFEWHTFSRRRQKTARIETASSHISTKLFRFGVACFSNFRSLQFYNVHGMRWMFSYDFFSTFFSALSIVCEFCVGHFECNKQLRGRQNGCSCVYLSIAWHV